MKRRVVVTGIGLVTPVGIGTDPTWAALLECQSGVGLITKFDTTQFSTKIAAELKGFDPLVWIEKKEVKKMDPFIQYAIAAADFAVKSSGLVINGENGPRVGVNIGSGIGGFSTIENQHTELMQGGPRKISPFFIPSCIINLAAGQVSIRHGAKGPNTATCTACSSGAHAIGDSFRIIQNGYADAMICGAAEAAITPLAVGGFGNMRALSRRNEEPQRASRPFDQSRDGFVMGEGSGILIIEELEQAKARGAKIIAELAGYGMSGDAYHITSPSEDGDGGCRVMQNAISDAGIKPEQVGYINAHGTSTPFNDKLETMAIKKVFGAHAKSGLLVSSTKSMTGHLLGAAGSVEAGLSALVVLHGKVPPTINYENPDPECDLDYVPNKVRETAVEYAMSNSFGFGGTNACLLFKRYNG
ncbi:MAG: beta-ketoacyl-ACP synthase II [Elusimicrobia bacterium]|nr:beta-ketoacyl-ACP synthase II [Elusimicrobiota bacterium]